MSMLTVNNIDLNQLIQQFWITEELPLTPKQTTDKINCELIMNHMLHTN